MQQHPTLRSLRIIGLSFIPVILGGAVAVIALRSGWSDADDTLSTIGLWVTAALGIIGLVVSARWRASVTERPVVPENLMTSYFVTVALAESGMLAGLVFSIVARSVTPFAAGAAIFAVSLAVILTALSQIDVEFDQRNRGVIR